MTRSLAFGAVILALVAGPSRAADPRQPPKEADLGQKRSVTPDASLGGSLEPAKKARAESGPALDFESFRKVMEVDISAKRREEMASLQKLIQLGGGSEAETPQWYFRLAELQWEESQYFFFEANRRDDRMIQLGKSSPAETARLQAEKKDLEAQTRRLQEQSVALYKAIVTRYPKFPRLDEVLYFLGENLSRRNPNDPDALKAYRALIERYPSRATSRTPGWRSASTTSTAPTSPTAPATSAGRSRRTARRPSTRRARSTATRSTSRPGSTTTSATGARRSSCSAA